MSETKYDGGPAFPTDGASFEGMTVSATHSGMTLRDYFATQALAGMLAGNKSDAFDGPLDFCIAKAAYRYADAMLNERAK